MKIIPRLFLFVLVTALAGCGYSAIPDNQKLMLSARYSDLAQRVDVETCENRQITTAQLYPVCVALSSLKQYYKLFKCLSCLEKNIKAGDQVYLDVDEMARLNPLSNAFADIRSQRDQIKIQFDIREYPYLLRAQAWIDLGDYPQAIEEARQGLRNIPRGSVLEVLSEINALSTLGLAYALQGDRNSAAETLRKLEAIDTGGGIGKGPANQIFKPDQNIGAARICMALGEFQKALDAMRRDDSAFFRGMVDIASGASLEGASLWTFQHLPKKFMLSKCLLETGSAQEAKRGLDELLDIPRTQDNGGLYWMVLFDRGRIAEKEGGHKAAIDFYRRAVDVIEQQRSTINTEASKIGFVGDKQSVYQHLVVALHADSQYAAAFEYVERAKSRALVDMLAVKQDFAVKTGDGQTIHELLSTTANEEKTLLVQDLSLNKAKIRGIVIQNREKLTAQSPELASLISVGVPDAADIRARLSADEILIEYYYTGKELFAFILSAKDLKSIRLKRDNLVEDIYQFRNLIADPASTSYMKLSQRLYDRLIRPLESYVDTPNLIVVPHGALHYLPFNALEDGKCFLIERSGIRILPSASMLKYLQAGKPSKPMDILVFGNPDLGDPRYDLIHAQSEAVAVAQAFPHSRILLRKEATEAAFRKYGGEFNYIHFATHGRFQADNPLKSAILLARDAGSDGMLTVDRLYSTKINADMVTLSACETGLGKITNGDDLVGLTRGFFYAGSRSVVASLWQVDDLSTSYLMASFYAGLKKMDKCSALRAAQLETKSKYPHPHYWASFQLTGNAK